MAAVPCRKAVLYACLLPDTRQEDFLQPHPQHLASGKGRTGGRAGPHSSQLHPSADCCASLQGRQGIHILGPREHSMIPLSSLQFTKLSFPMPLLAQFRLKNSLCNG